MAGVWPLTPFLLSALTAVQAREKLVESVDMAVPVAPATVRGGGRIQIVHELHVTNFLRANVSLERVQVLSADGPERVLADHAGDELGLRLGRPGLGRDHADPHLLGPGMRAVIYLWIELADRPAPERLRHRLELEILKTAGPVRAVVEGGLASVSGDGGVVLGPPLKGGPWVAIHDALLKGGHRTVFYALGGRARIPGRFAVDWIRLPPAGRFQLEPSPRPADWNGSGAEVLAVADAVVAAAMDDIPDNTGPSGAGAHEPENASGNYVTLDLGDGRFAFYEHLRHGSVAVKPGDRVRRGQPVGRLGNSGSSSIGPHLHFHVADASSPLGAEGVPFVLADFRRLGAFASLAALVEGQAWLPDADREGGARRLELPGPLAVVEFP